MQIFIARLASRFHLFPKVCSAAQQPPAHAGAHLVAQVAQADGGAGIRPDVEATEIARLLAVGVAAVLHAIQGIEILLVGRIHGYGFPHMLQSRDLVAHPLVGQGA